MEKPAHLRDIFKVGEPLMIEYPGKPDTEVWIQRPSHGQFEICNKKAKIKRARRAAELRSEGNEERMAMVLDFEQMDKEELLDTMLEERQGEFERRAFNEVLYAESTDDEETVTDYGTYWGPEGQQYMELLDALIQRAEELNEELGEDDSSVWLHDPEIQRLNDKQQLFYDEVKARAKVLYDAAAQDLSHLSTEKLRKKCLDQAIDQECDTVWYTEFKMHMAFFAVRQPDQHSEFYFEKAIEIFDLPIAVQEQIIKAVDRIDQSSEQVKNLLTPLPS